MDRLADKPVPSKPIAFYGSGSAKPDSPTGGAAASSDLPKVDTDVQDRMQRLRN